MPGNSLRRLREKPLEAWKNKQINRQVSVVSCYVPDDGSLRLEFLFPYVTHCCLDFFFHSVTHGCPGFPETDLKYSTEALAILISLIMHNPY